MKLLYVAAESSNWVLNLCNEFCKEGHDVTCIVQNSDEYDSENSVKPHDNLKVFTIPFNTFLNTQRLVHIIDKHLEEGNYDFVFGSHAPVSPAVVWTARKHKVLNGIMLLDIPTDLIKADSNRALAWKNTFPYLVSSDLIITNTEACAEEFKKFTNKKILDEDIITYAINLHPMFRNLELNKKKPYVVSVCRLSSIKNCILIPKALKELNLDLKYVAIGRDSGQLNDIKRYCEENGVEFEYLGTVSEYKKFEIIKDATALIYPQNSEYIGGLSPFEAMYVGTPAIVPDLKVLKDLYADNAIYFNNNDEISLSNKIAEVVYNNLDSEFYKRAHDYAVSEASFSNMAKQMLNSMKRIKVERK